MGQVQPSSGLPRVWWGGVGLAHPQGLDKQVNTLKISASDKMNHSTALRFEFRKFGAALCEAELSLIPHTLMGPLKPRQGQPLCTEPGVLNMAFNTHPKYYSLLDRPRNLTFPFPKSRMIPHPSMK